MQDRKLIVGVAKGMLLLLLAMLACKYTAGGGALLIAGVAVVCAFAGKIGWSMIAYILFPFMIVLNPVVLPKTGITGMVLRFAPMVVTVVLVITAASRRGRHQIPMGMMWPFLGVAALCSMNGYFPQISYLKILNCAILFIGLNIGFRNIDKRPGDVFTIRQFLLVVSAFLVWGSVLLLVFMPGAAYLSSMRLMGQEGISASAALLSAPTGMTLFCGMTNQSQCLAVVLPVTMAWLACDMFFVEKRLTKFHMLTIAAGLPLVYMTRSRSGLLTSVVAATLIYGYCLKKVNLRQSIRRKLKSAMMGLGVLIILCAGVMEVKSHAITKWLRKTEDVAGDTRGFGEAVTESRMGLVESSMADFRSNPLFGTGFQVAEYMKYAFKDEKGLILSAPIEKGVLPVMVLGETGIIGSIFFWLFIVTFYVGCVKKRLYCCATLHTVFIVTNMAEATYFSPGGIGGYLWVMCVGGGFIIDTIVLHHRRLEAIARQQQIEWMMAGGGEGNRK